MAASLSRPDPSSPASVAEAGFSTARRGYNQDEVRALLTSVAAELGRLQERQRQLEAELHAARSAPTSTIELDEETVTTLLGEETLRVLHTARESASEIKIRAEENAARILREAHDEVNRLRQETEVEAARRRYDASADAEAELALAKQQGREMVNEARAYRERVLADLERRTTLARHQIEELVHGRDRLLQVFERARLVAVDVTSELQAIDGPDELVDLSPTTGPVPLMVPTDRAAAEPSRDELADADGDGDVPVGDSADGEPTDDDQSTELIDLVDAAEAEAAHAEALPEDSQDAVAESAPAAGQTGDSGRLERDANVVSLFRGRATSDAEAGEDAAGEDVVTSDAEAGEDAGGEDVVTSDAEAGEDAAGEDVAGEDVVTSDAEAGEDAAGEDVVTSDAEAGEDAAGEDVVTSDAEAGEDAAGEDAVTSDEADRPDVGGIFARLRSETPVDEAVAEPDGEVAAATEPNDEVDTEEQEAEPTAFARRDEAIVPLIVSAARKIKRVLADEQNGVLDTLRRNEPVTSLDDLLPEIGEHLAVYVAALEEYLIGAAAAGAGEVGINDTKTLRRRLAKTGALEAAHDLLRTDMLRPLRDRLERAVADGSGDNDDITKRARAVYREWKTQHIDDQLDDVCRFAHGGGLAVSVEPGAPLAWSIDPGHPACPDCEDNSLAGSVAAGEAFPTGHTAAPAHPGCRCLTLPVAQ